MATHSPSTTDEKPGSDPAAALTGALSEYGKRAGASMGRIDHAIVACDMLLRRAIPAKNMLGQRYKRTGNLKVGEEYQRAAATVANLQALRSRLQSIQGQIDPTNNAQRQEQPGK